MSPGLFRATAGGVPPIPRLELTFLCANKFVEILDRQHPRDLFDLMPLLKGEALTILRLRN